MIVVFSALCLSLAFAEFLGWLRFAVGYSMPNTSWLFKVVATPFMLASVVALLGLTNATLTGNDSPPFGVSTSTWALVYLTSRSVTWWLVIGSDLYVRIFRRSKDG